jgi:hypothetical protein
VCPGLYFVSRLELHTATHFGGFSGAQVALSDDMNHSRHIENFRRLGGFPEVRLCKNIAWIIYKIVSKNTYLSENIKGAI